VSDALQWLHDLAGARDAAGMRRALRPRAVSDPALDLASNDYLGLARDPRVTGAAAEAALAWGAGSTGSRLVTGSTAAHDDLQMDW
jgi:8-amino-7-oxononanoate synthase